MHRDREEDDKAGAKFVKVEVEEGTEELFSSKRKDGTMLRDKKAIKYKKKSTTFIFTNNDVDSVF